MEGEEGEGESEPLILVGIEGVEGGIGGHVAAMVVVVRGAEREEAEGRGLGGDEVYEGR